VPLHVCICQTKKTQAINKDITYSSSDEDNADAPFVTYKSTRLVSLSALYVFQQF
jgi:hypothetical protein